MLGASAIAGADGAIRRGFSARPTSRGDLVRRDSTLCAVLYSGRALCPLYGIEPHRPAAAFEWRLARAGKKSNDRAAFRRRRIMVGVPNHSAAPIWLCFSPLPAYTSTRYHDVRNLCGLVTTDAAAKKVACSASIYSIAIARVAVKLRGRTRYMSTLYINQRARRRFHLHGPMSS